MTGQETEQLHREAAGLDMQPPDRILDVLARAQVEAASSVIPALPAIAEAARLAAEALSAGGRLIYAAAGSSGLMALADALELPGTFGIARDRILVLLAGGAASLMDLGGSAEDDGVEVEREIAAAEISASDTLIAISASGSTPYALAAIKAARARKARVVAIANNEGAPLLSEADVAICLQTPPEPLAGSTRMGAGTAQKIALNLLSTLMAIHLGHVHDGYMVNLRADNAKLKERATRIVAAVGGCAKEDARAHLDAADGSVKRAILLASGITDAGAADRLLDQTGQRLRPALSALREGRGNNPPGA